MEPPPQQLMESLMEAPTALVAISVVALLLALLLRLTVGSMDRKRIVAYFETSGASVIKIQWQLFGTGWLAAHHERIYEVWYIDCDGAPQHAECKTSLLGGVYLTQVLRATVPAKKALDDMDALRAENDALRREVAALRRDELDARGKDR